MRYDRKIELIKVSPGTFNEKTANCEGGTETRTPLYASVMDTRTEMVKLVYGTLRQGSLTIQLQNPVDQAFDWIEMNGRRYKVDFRRHLRTKETFIVTEVQT